MLIITGNFVEIKKDYLEKFKKQIDTYESNMENKEMLAEQQEIKNEFFGNCYR